VLFIFILGVLIFKNTQIEDKPDLFDNYFPVITYVILIFFLVYLGVHNLLLVAYVRETILGILLGLPIVTYLANCKIKAPMNHLLGDLSYGLFLSHFLVMWVISYYSLIDKTINPHFYNTIIFTISLIISWIGVFIVEKKIKKYRFNLSKFWK
jgi:peptidoglycan/LPS O-acetylase OafA/YrhL